jgi:hypothetical protein
MPIDTSIYRSNPLRSVADYEKELTDAQTSRQQVGLNKLALDAGRTKQDEYQRGIQKANALQAITSNFGPDPELNAQLLVQKGYVPEAQKYRENEYDIAKKRADSVKVMADALDKKIQQHQGLLSQVQNPQMAAQWMQAAYQDPDLGKIVSRLGPPEEAIKSIPQDPQGFQNWILQASAGSEKLRAQLQGEARDAETKANNLRTDARVKSEGAANRGVQMRGQDITSRGQDMTDARAREVNDTTKAAAADAKQAAADAKQAEKIDKAVTKFSDTLQKEGIPELENAVSGAEAVLGKYEKGKVPGIGTFKNALPAAAMSDEGKDVRQALAQVRNIVLSARSGAAVTDQELRRLVEEIGTGVGMSEDDARRGLARIRTRLEIIKQNTAAGVSDEVKSVYEDRGGVKINRGGDSKPENKPSVSNW